MIIAIPKETLENESRVAATPHSVSELIKAGYTVKVEAGAGEASFFYDDNYKKVNSEIVATKEELYKDANIILKVTPPTTDEINLFSKGTVCVSFFQPTIDIEKVKAMSKNEVTGLSMHLVTSTTLAQKMEALSSQANIAGYKSVLLAASALDRYFPMLMTAAGTVQPAKVVVLGAGVAGLQAIATAKRLGAVVFVSDIRPAVKEQIESLGARFIEPPELEEDSSESGGYAKQVSENFLVAQRLQLARQFGNLLAAEEDEGEDSD